MEMKDLFKEHTEVVESRLDELGVNVNEVKARLDEVEQKAARAPGDAPSAPPTAGSQFVAASEVKSFLENPSAGRRIGLEMKATITSATTLADGSAGDLTTAYRDTTLLMPKRRMTVRGLLPVVQVTQGSVEYPKQTGLTNNAATVAEGATKPQSELQYDLVQVPIRTIAHWMLASRQILDDAPQLQGLIDTELRYGLSYVEDAQLLNGAGTGTDLNGIYSQATAFAAGSNIQTSPNRIDVILFSILQGALADLPPTGVVMHPSDWTLIRGLKNADGDYIMGPPGADVEPRLFGLPVVATPAMGAGTFLTGDFQGSATLYDRWQARVEVSTEDSDNFRKNLVTVLCEERIGLAVKRTNAFIKGTFAAAITDLTS